MRLQAGYYYHLISGGILLLSALTMLVKKDWFAQMNSNSRTALFWVLVLWGGYRIYHGVTLYRKRNRHEI